LFLGKYVPLENEKQLWNLENDFMLHKIDKEKLPKLNQNWWEYYLERFDEKLPKDLRKNELNFYILYDKLSDKEKPHFIPEQKISIRKIIEADETENIKQRNVFFKF
jgi:hypothetical protein